MQCILLNQSECRSLDKTEVQQMNGGYLGHNQFVHILPIPFPKSPIKFPINEPVILPIELPVVKILELV